MTIYAIRRFFAGEIIELRLMIGQHLLAAITIFGDHGWKDELSEALNRANQYLSIRAWKDLKMASVIVRRFFAALALLSLMTLTMAPAFAQKATVTHAPKKAPAVSAPASPPAAAQDQDNKETPAPATPAPDAQAQQQAQPKAPEPPKQLVGTTTGWVRVCQKVKDTDKEGCSIKQDVVAENGAFLASMAVQEVTGEQRRQLIITTPLGMALQAGLLMRIDSEKAMPAKFGTCLVNGCFAGLDITLDMVNAMKKGKNAFITVRNIQGAALDLTVPLTTFAKAYDGPAMDVQALQESQKKLQEELLKRAEKAREELMKQQGQGVAPKMGN
jgi:invasion protein IalB